MRKLIFATTSGLIAAAVVFMLVFSKRAPVKIPQGKTVNTGFVVMELFTSQGCSSCPPADEIAGGYARKNDDRIIPLSFHVDYWNRLGWVDSFSNKAFTERQRKYARQLNLESVYTPQLIINGETELIGSDEEKIAGLVNRYSSAMPVSTLTTSAVKIEGNVVQVNYAIDKLNAGSSINAALVLSTAITRVEGGENRGVELKAYNVVRDFISKPLTANTGAVSLNLPTGALPANYQLVLFVQENDSGKITGMTHTRL